jgi:hypothetical protein
MLDCIREFTKVFANKCGKGGKANNNCFFLNREF